MCLVLQDSPVNKLLYAREIPRYKQLVERLENLNVIQRYGPFQTHILALKWIQEILDI